MRTLLVLVAAISLVADATGADRQGGPSVKPSPISPPAPTLRFGGEIGRRIEANEKNWLLTAPASNPAMLGMFRDRDRKPARDLLPWSGEFAGKYLISAVQGLRLTGNRELRRHLERFVADLIATQDEDGYLGPFPRTDRFFKPGTWDLWGQYHVMLGLLAWYQETGDLGALKACRRAADLFCRVFLDEGRRIGDAGSEEMNQSAIHIFPLLYRETGDPRYLRMAERFLAAWEEPPSGDFVRIALDGKAFYQGPKPRWEGLHGLQALVDLYGITGEQKYRSAFERLWWSMAEYDRHNTGGFSSGEKACGNPYDPGAIETCCTVAWMAMSVDMLRLTGDARVADELELSTWNAILGAQERSGRWFTYNTPMDGDRKASTQEIAFQARPGSPELNCCSVNGPRGLGMLADWAVRADANSLSVYYYGPMTASIALPSGHSLTLEQETTYPVGDKVHLRLSSARPERFVLKVRLPGWSRRTEVRVNGVPVAQGRPGTMQELDREWKPGDHVDITFDMSPRLWVGERECAGKASVYHGPLLMALDPRFQDNNSTDLSLGRDLKPVPVKGRSGSEPGPLLLSLYGSNGPVLCDFASAGATGLPYSTWLSVSGVQPVPFTRENPLRSLRP